MAAISTASALQACSFAKILEGNFSVTPPLSKTPLDQLQKIKKNIARFPTEVNLQDVMTSELKIGRQCKKI